jgi:hypothetical protein
MQQYQDGIRAYLDSGGRLMIEGLDIVSGYHKAGSLDESFVTNYMGCDSLHMAPISGLADSTVDWTINSGKFMSAPPFAEIPGDTTITMRSTLITNGLRGFALRDTSDVVIWARRGNLSPANVVDVPIAISVPGSSFQPVPAAVDSARLIITTFPLFKAWSVQWPGVPRLLAKLFKQMGLAQ